MRIFLLTVVLGLLVGCGSGSKPMAQNASNTAATGTAWEPGSVNAQVETFLNQLEQVPADQLGTFVSNHPDEITMTVRTDLDVRLQERFKSIMAAKKAP